MPLHTLRADIDYGFREAKTTAGRIGVKVWLYKGDILPYKTSSAETRSTAKQRHGCRRDRGCSKPRNLCRRRPVAAEVAAPVPGRRRLDGRRSRRRSSRKPTPSSRRLLEEEEEIERTTREHHEAPALQARRR